VKPREQEFINDKFNKIYEEGRAKAAAELEGMTKVTISKYQKGMRGERPTVYLEPSPMKGNQELFETLEKMGWEKAYKDNNMAGIKFRTYRKTF